MTRRSCIFGLAIVGAILAVGLVIGLRIHFEIQGRDEEALRAHYSGLEVTVTNSVESPSIQTCFQVDLRDPSAGSRSTRVAMFSGGSDNDNWTFSAEYRTLADCVAAFYRG